MKTIGNVMNKFWKIEIGGLNLAFWIKLYLVTLGLFLILEGFLGFISGKLDGKLLASVGVLILASLSFIGGRVRKSKKKM